MSTSLSVTGDILLGQQTSDECCWQGIRSLYTVLTLP